MAKPVFIVGSGRCGTASFARMLNKVEGVEAYHEYRVEGFPALEESKAQVWVNSDYRLSWRVLELAERYPDAKFLGLVRDGRKVVSSFFHKMPIEHGHQEPFPGDFVPMSEFERCCVHWRESNKAIIEAFAALPNERWAYSKLEDLVADEEILQSVVERIGIEYSSWMYEFLQIPQHVIVPIDFSLSAAQLEIFERIVGPMMRQFRYKDSYEMSYES